MTNYNFNISTTKMKKHLLLISTLAIALVSAQNNDGLKREFERQNKENNEKFDSYVSRRFGSDRNPETQKNNSGNERKSGGFSGNVPNFYQSEDQTQILNNNVDA